MPNSRRGCTARRCHGAVRSQLPVKAWHTYLDDPTLADAILDRIVHSSHKIELKTNRSLRENDNRK